MKWITPSQQRKKFKEKLNDPRISIAMKNIITQIPV